MSVFSDLYRGRNRFQIVARRRIWLSAAVIASVGSVIALLVLGLNLSIDFKGGTVWKLSYAQGAGAIDGVGGASGIRPSESELRDAASRAGAVPEKILFLGGEQIEIQGPAVDANIATRVSVELASIVGVPAENAQNLISSTTISPTWGGQVSSKALRALVIFLIAVSIYISWRFEWKMAIAAFAALTHDILITVGIYSVTRFTVAPATVIATLTILGYSLYDDVVVFDRLKEATRMASGLRRDYATVVNDSLNQVLMRSLNTSLSTLLPIGALLFGGVAMGNETLKFFALALFVGVLAGTYSSIFIATPLIVVLGRSGSTSRAAIRAARGTAREEVLEEARVGRTRRPTPDRLAALLDEEELEEGDSEVSDDTEGQADVEAYSGRSRPQGQAITDGKHGTQHRSHRASKQKKGRPRGSRPAGGKGKRRKKR